MTRKDFVVIADALRELKSFLNKGDYSELVWVMSGKLAITYANFNRDKFIDYCMKEVER